jgi:thiol-disulfide isomerase/thioredoxin
MANYGAKAVTHPVIQRWLKRIPVILLLGFVMFYFFRSYSFKAPKQVDMASLKLVYLDGSPISANVIHGKAMVLNFWAPWCPPCRAETPWLQHLQTSHPKDLVVIGIVADPGQYLQAQTFMASRGITYILVRETPSVDDIFGAVEGLPTTFYISATGKVVHTARGLIPEILMKHYVNQLF